MSFWDTLKGIGSEATGLAPYVAPIIERHRQRDLQQMALQRQQDEQDKKDAMAAASGQSTIARNQSTTDLNNARANVVRNPVPKAGAIKTIAAQDGTLYRIYPDGTYEAAPTHAPETPKMPGVAEPIPSAPVAGPPQASVPQQSAGPAPKFGPRPPLPKPVTPGPLTTATNDAGRAFRARVGPNGVIAPLTTAQGDTAFVPKPAVKPTPGSFGTVTVGGENGAPGTIKAFDKHTGQTGASIGPAPVRAAGGMNGGMGAGGIGGVARTSAAITGMAQAEPLMTEFENDPKRQLGGLDYWQKMRAGMYDAHGIKDEATHAAVYSHLNQTNPGLANYLRNAETWALEDSQLSGKASDFRLKLDGFISQIGPNADETQKRTTQMFRQTRLAELKRFQPAMQAIGDRIAGGGGRGGAATPPTQEPPEAPTGNINLGATPPTTKAMKATPQQLERAKTDSLFARFLKDTGKMP